jgi:hypothetical protein
MSSTPDDVSDDVNETIESLENSRSRNAREAFRASLSEAYEKGRADASGWINIDIDIGSVISYGSKKKECTEPEETLEDESKRNSMNKIGYGLAALGTGAALGGGALAHQELTEEERISTVVPPESYEVVYTEDLEEIAGEMEFSSNEIIATAGTDMEEILDRQPHTQHKIGFSEDDMYLDWGSNGRRYDLDDAYSEAKDIADSVVT